jgi:hypothetical protein
MIDGAVLDTVLRFPDVEAKVLARTGTLRGHPAVEDALAAFADLVLDYLQARWPVRTGLSRASFVVIPAASGIGIRILNGTDYAQYVHRAGTPPAPVLAEILLGELAAIIPAPLWAAIAAELPAQAQPLRRFGRA